ncbi:MAG: HAD-IIB family hydrolase [Clostridiales bacterium]|nr:HAD-IIB family hydrolase [Clostridiales bacterium]
MASSATKDFSRWLVVSDIDGTLNDKFRRLPDRNLKAIERFVVELGGHFTLASGRSVLSLKKHFHRLPISNTPAIVLNGAGIYDYSLEKMIHFNAINESGQEIVRKVHAKFPFLEIQICTIDHIYMVNARVFGPAIVGADKLPNKRCKKLEEVPTSAWGKVIFLGLPPIIKRVIAYAQSLNDGEVHFMSSSVVTYEMLAKDTHKGTAVKKLAEILNIEYEHTAAIGDFFNDYDMLRSVFLPAACKQAPKEIHAIVKFHACHCNQGAVADFLEYIERNY